MNKTQKRLLVVFLALTLLILVLNNLYPSDNKVIYLKYLTVFSLFLIAFKVRKNTLEQKIMSIAFLMLVIGDFFLVLSKAFYLPISDPGMFGSVAFAFAYLCLISVYKKNIKVGRAEMLIAAPLIIAFLAVLHVVFPYVNAFKRFGVILFGLILCCMSWTAVCTLYTNSFSPRASQFIAISGVLMFLCDLGVGMVYFLPHAATSFAPILSSIIWAAYIPGWTLLEIVICDVNPLICAAQSSENEEKQERSEL